MIVDAHAHIVVRAAAPGPGRAGRWRPQVTEAGGRSRIDLPGPERRAHRARRRGSGPVQRPRCGAAAGPATAARDLRTLVAGGLAGVELTPGIDGRYLGEDAFWPFWEAAEETGAVLFVHPATRGLALPVFGDYYLWNSVANPVETAIAAAHLVMAGVLERHPELKIVLAHGGGALWAVRGRLRRAYAQVPAARSRLREPPDASLARLYHDTVTHDPGLLRRLIEDAGPDHVLLGSDRPFDMGSDDPVGEVRALGLPAEAEAAVLGGNAARLLG